MKRILTAALPALVLLAGSASAQGDDDLRARIRALERRNEKIEKRYDTVIGRLEKAEERNAELEARLLDQTVPERRDEMETLVNRLVEFGDFSDRQEYGNRSQGGARIQFYGMVRTDMIYSQARFDDQINAFWLQPEDGTSAENNDDAFSLDARLTRVGIAIDFGDIGPAETTGVIEFDFSHFQETTAESRTRPRLRLAYVNLDFGDIVLRAGQDWDIISPYDPIVDEHSKLWNTGNLGDLRPQFQAFWRGGNPLGVSIDVGLALGLTGAVENDDNDFVSGPFLTNQRDGFDSGHPHVQLSTSVGFGSWVQGERINIGAWGAWGRLETDARFNDEDHFTTWVLGLDLYLPLIRDVHLKGEFFYGQALADFRGGVGQSINTLEGDEIKSIGGWGELYWQTSKFFGIGIGAAIDNPERGDLDVADRASNWVAYLATRQQWSDEIQTGLDVMFWKTQYIAREEGDAFRINAYIQVSF